MTLLIFLLILSVLVLIHEFGHFIVAKKNGVFVEEFGWGIPPRVWGKKIGETIYSINLLPFGGFVKLRGEDVDGDVSAAKSDPRNYMSKTPFVRGLILTAGVIMNIVLAVVLYFVLFFITGFKSMNIPVFFDYHFRFGDVMSTNTVVSGFIQNSNAEKAGITLGEAILTIDDVPVKNLEEIRTVVQPKPNEIVTLRVRDLRKHDDTVGKEYSFMTTSNDEGKGVLGVYIAESASIYYPNKLLAPFQHSYNMLAYTMYTFGQFIDIAFESKSVEPVSSGVSGPVGIYSVVEAILGYGGIDALLGLIDFAALLSLSLAFMNLLPLPALDGGRFIFVLYEGLVGKPINQKYETWLHKWGMLFLLTLLVLVTIKDVRQLITF